MRDLFFAMYGTGLEWTIWCLLFLLTGIVLLIVSLVKLKKKAKIAGIIVSALLIWQIVPVVFYWKAYFSRTDMTFLELIAAYNGQTKYRFNDNYSGYIKYMKIAANTSLIPWQKGACYCDIAKEYAESKDGFKALEYYEKGYKYIKSYKYNYCWFIADVVYYESNDIKTAIKIADALKFYGTASIYCTTDKNYKKALDYANKHIEQYPNSYHAFARRAYINHVLGNNDAEILDYKQALSLVNSEKEKQYVIEYKQIGSKELAGKKQAAKNFGFVKE